MGKRLIDGSIFLHIPKTGGSFVEKFLNSQNLIIGNAGGKHDDIFRCLYPQGYKHEVARVVKGFPKKIKTKIYGEVIKHDWTNGPHPDQPTEETLPVLFCFVRNPIAWIESYYRYTKEQNWYYWSSEYDYYGFWHPNSMLNDLRADSFNVFVENLLKKRPGYVTEMYGWYTTSGITKIYKTENLNSNLIDFLETRNLKFDSSILKNMKKINESSKKDDIKWDLDLKNEFIKTEYSGFKRYKYDIDEIY